MMKAVISTSYGESDVLQVQEVNKPSPKANEILIKVHAAAITTAGSMMRTGKPYIGRLFMGMFRPKHPIPGTGFAGVVEHIGSDVQLFNVGDRVFGESIETFGTQAEYLSLPEDGIIMPIPPNMTFEEAAPICDGALTSMNFLKKIANIHPGQQVLINGASGSLGTAAVQLAKYYGATVTGICSTSNLELVRSLGADQVIDYTKEDFAKNEKTYDIIYDTIGGLSFGECKGSLTDNGQYISPVLGWALLFQSMWTSLFGQKKAKFAATGMAPVTELKKMFKEIISLVKNGDLESIMDRRYSIDQIVQAHDYIDSGRKKGNVVMKFQ